MQAWTQRRASSISFPQVRIAPSTLLSYLLIGLIALAPRALNLGGFVNIDEINHWIGRAGAFLLALRAGDYAAMAISKHPGVTTMWLGAAGSARSRVRLDLPDTARGATGYVRRFWPSAAPAWRRRSGRGSFGRVADVAALLDARRHTAHRLHALRASARR